MTGPALSADCTRCAALCCMALAIDRSSMFDIDKPAGAACPNLDDTNKCRIHGELMEKGFGGCVRFDCLGAGQRVTQELFGGRSWRDDPSLVEPMSDAFRKMRQVHELLLLLETAADYDLSVSEREKCQELTQILQPEAGAKTSALISGLERSDIFEKVDMFLKGLKDRAARPENRKSSLEVEPI